MRHQPIAPLNAFPFGGARAGCTQAYLDCGLHEVATGERDSADHADARLRIATRLVEAGADPDNRQHGCGGTPLHHTLAGGFIELAKFLVERKADVNASNRYGPPPCPCPTTPPPHHTPLWGGAARVRVLTRVAPSPVFFWQACTRCTLR